MEDAERRRGRRKGKGKKKKKEFDLGTIRRILGLRTGKMGSLPDPEERRKEEAPRRTRVEYRNASYEEGNKDGIYEKSCFML